MNARGSGLGWLFSAILSLFFGGYSFLRWFGIAFTAGDGLMEPAEVCNAACRLGWEAYGRKAGSWMYLAVACFFILLISVHRGAKAYRRGIRNGTTRVDAS